MHCVFTLYVVHLHRTAGTLPCLQRHCARAIRMQFEDDPWVKEFPGSRLAPDRRANARGGILGVQKKAMNDRARS